MKIICFRYKCLLFFLIVILTSLLYLSYNYSLNDIFDTFSLEIFAAEKRESSFSTKYAQDGADMIDLLARLVNGEARGESYQGQVAVAAVVMNRVKSPLFPNTISGVIYQKNQFSCIKDGQFNKAIDKNSTVYKAAKEAYNGADPTNGALYFYNPKTAKSSWLYSLKTVTTIGNHVFAVNP